MPLCRPDNKSNEFSKIRLYLNKKRRSIKKENSSEFTEPDNFNERIGSKKLEFKRKSRSKDKKGI